MSVVKLPPDSDISVRVKRGTPTECTAELLVNDKVFGSCSIPKGVTGEFTMFGFRTPKSGNTVINIDNKKQLNFKLTIFGKLLGLE